MASRPRTDLSKILREILGTTNVYFQPPPTVEMKYPCIVYERSSADSQFADNIPYVHKKRYKVTYIDTNPDSEIPDKIANLPMCVFDRHYTADNLHHDAFNLYF